MSEAIKKSLPASLDRGEGGSGGDETIIKIENSSKLAVIELSTKAVKMIIGDTRSINGEFDFADYKNFAELTNTGESNSADNIIDFDIFFKKVFPAVDKMLNIARGYKVGAVYSVATAVYRSAIEREKILEYIKDKFGLNVRIISKEEEALASFDAFRFSGKKYIGAGVENILMIDQGGGSTQVLVRKGSDLEFNYSVDLGTVSLKNEMANILKNDGSLADALKTIRSKIKERLEIPLEKHSIGHDIDCCVGLGTAITRSTGVRSNKYQHGMVLAKNKIAEKIEMIGEEIMLTEKKYLDFIFKTYNKPIDYKYFDNTLSMFLGLPIYLEIMDKYKADKIIVSGTALRYGIFWQKASKINSLSI